MKVTRHNFLEVMETRWVALWRKTAERLEKEQGAECRVWSHSVGAATPFDGWTMGIEIRGTRHEHATRVRLIVEFSQVRQGPKIYRGGLDWTGPESETRHFRRPCRLGQRSWRRLQRQLRSYSEILESALRYPASDELGAVAGMVLESVDQGFTIPMSSGQVPDLQLWRAYLRQQSAPVALGRRVTRAYFPQDGEAEAVDYLLSVEPRLRQDTILDALSERPGYDLENLDWVGPGVAVEFIAHEPSDLIETLEPWYRSFYKNHPTCRGAVHLSRVGSGPGQSLLLVSELTMDETGPSGKMYAAMQFDEQPDIAIHSIPLEELWERRHRSRDERSLSDEYSALATSEKFPEIRTVVFHEGIRPRVKVEFVDGRDRLYEIESSLIIHGVSYPRARLLLTREHDPAAVLQACVDDWRGVEQHGTEVPPVPEPQSKPWRLMPYDTGPPLERYLRNRAEVMGKLLPLLEALRDRLTRKQPQLEIRVWAHEAGRSTSLQAYTFGIACPHCCLAVNVMRLHISPRFHATLLDPKGRVLARSLDQTRLKRADVLSLLQTFESLAERPSKANQPLSSAAEALTPEQTVVLWVALKHFRQRHNLPGPLVLFDRTQAPDWETSWLETAPAYFQNDLPGLTRDLLEATRSQGQELAIPECRDYSLISREFFPSTFLHHLYEHHLDAPGVVTASAVGLESDGRYALVALSLRPDIEVRQELGYSFRRIGGYGQHIKGPPRELILLERCKETWQPIGVRDLRLREPIAMQESRLESDVRRMLTSPLLLEGLELASVLVTRVTHRRFQGTVFDLTLVDDQNRRSEVSLGHNLRQIDERPKVFPHPIACLLDLDEESLYEALLSLKNQTLIP